MNIAIIPARGGSKRIPRKNIRLFNGRPLISYSIAAAQASGCFARIIVSTEDPEIAEVARDYGAETPFLRPADLADDYIGTGAVVNHAVRWLQEQGISLNLICCIYATAPLLTPEVLQEGMERLQAAPDKLFAFSVTSFTFPIQRAVRLVEHGGVEPFQPDCIPKRSQDLEEAYHDAGQFYWGRAQAYLQGAPMFAPHSIPIVLPRHRVQDIDTLEDWVRAEYLHRAIQMAERESGEHRHSR